MTAECDNETCPVARAVRILDGKWTILVIRTEQGRTLEPVVGALAAWGRGAATPTG